MKNDVQYISCALVRGCGTIFSRDHLSIAKGVEKDSSDVLLASAVRFLTCLSFGAGAPFLPFPVVKVWRGLLHKRPLHACYCFIDM